MRKIKKIKKLKMALISTKIKKTSKISREAKKSLYEPKKWVKRAISKVERIKNE